MLSSQQLTPISGRGAGALGRHVLGGLAGAAAFALLVKLLPALPVPVRFILSWGVFTFGPGVVVAGSVARALDPARRLIVVLGAGSAIVPALLDVLGRLHAVPVFPYVASACAGAGLIAWRRGAGARTPAAEWMACGAVCALTIALGVIVFSHRLDVSHGAVVLYGDYDSADLGYYAAEASEASHTIPPMASYYSGHRLNAAYYPQLVNGMIHRFGAVPLLDIYYRFAWPAFVTLGALVMYVLVRSLASRSVALLTVIFVVLGSDFSYLAAWFLPHAAVDWDYLLWPTNFLSPTMQVLHFSTWAPSLPVFFTAIFAIVRGLQTGERGWLVLSALLVAILFEFKPFAYIVLMAGLSASFVFAHGDGLARLRYAGTIALSALFTVPFLLPILTLDPADRRSRLLVDPFLLPKRMLIKIDETETFMRAAAHLAPWPSLRTPVFLLLATVVFLAVGLGVRWIGAPGVWRAIRRPAGQDAASWRVLAWCVVAGIAIPFVIATDPYVDTLQFYLTGLYLLWIFTAAALVAMARARPAAGAVAVVAAFALSLPSSVHYLAWKWTEATRPAKADLSAGDLLVAQYLRSTDPEQTVILHDRPLSPSLMAVVSERRIVLGWDVKYSAVGGEERLRDVDTFFDSANGDPKAALETLRRYAVTHVIVRDGEDRVHPEVLDRLQLVLRAQEVALYAVPAAARQ
jgi:hypothetical protein